MPETPYQVALLTRGTGRVSYTWLGPPGLAPGALCAVVFRGRIETGILLAEDTAPPQTKLALLWPLIGEDADRMSALQKSPALPALPAGYGPLLLSLCELCVAAPDELSGHLLFDSAAKSLRLYLALHDPSALPPLLLSQAGALSGPLKALQRRLLASAAIWEPLARLSWERPVAPIEMSLRSVGSPLVTRALPSLRKGYALDRATQSLLGLGLTERAWPGHYLAGLHDPPSLSELLLRRMEKETVAGADAALATAAAQGPANVLAWQAAELNPAWEICQRWPKLARLPLRRLSVSWEELRQAPPAAGLAAELGRGIEAGQKLLLICPQAWLLDRLWPLLADWGASCLRFRAESGPGSSAYLLSRLCAPGGLLCASGPAGVKLAAWGRFDRVLLLDPTHPQFEPSRAPFADPRLMLLLLLSRWLPAEGEASIAAPRLDLLELGLSALDGTGGRALSLWPPHEPDGNAPPQRGQKVDTDPLPLPLRQPGLRRLIYFNRLGSGRGLSCAECQRPALCPNCGGGSVYYSQRPAGYVCPACNWRGRELRCSHCGLSTLSMQSPGLEAVAPRAGDIVVAGTAHKAPSAQTQRLLGTASLLDEESAFWPQEIVYVHAQTRLGPWGDWPAALDMALRLASLYANPQLEGLHIVSARLEQQFGPSLSATQIAKQFRQEQGLRKLAGLPPFGCLYGLHATAQQASQLEAARHALGEALSNHPGTTLLRLGRPYSLGRGIRLSGYLANAELSLRELLELRWRIAESGASLQIQALRSPWGL